MMKKIIRLSALFSLVGLLLITSVTPMLAGPGEGDIPQMAVAMSSGLNVGQMTPGAHRWYRVNADTVGGQGDHMVVLNMVYKPGNHEVAPYVNFQVLAGNQVDRWLQGFPDAVMGIGTFTTTDFDQDTSERLWSGSMLKEDDYYVHLFNNSGVPVEYHLLVMSQPVQIVVAEAAPMPEVAVASAETPKAERAAAVEPLPGQSPKVATDLVLRPGAGVDEARWTLVATAVQRMSTAEAATWLLLASQVGLLPGSAPLNPAMATLPANATWPLQPVQALPGAAPDAAGLTAPPAASQPAPVNLFDLYPNVYPYTPLALHDGANVGKLAPGGEHWYSFVRDGNEKKHIGRLELTMFATPTDGNTSRYINFQIYPAGQMQLWKRGTPQDMVPMGQGQWVSRDKDPVTGERLWAGPVINGDIYYVRIVNGSDQVIDYYLITGDVFNTELGNKVFEANQRYPYVLRPANRGL